MKELIKKMKYADTWFKNDLGEVLAAYNPTIGDESFFKDLIYSAHEAGIIKPTSFPYSPNNGFFSEEVNFTQYNFQYARESLIDWVASKAGWMLPEEIQISEIDFPTIEPEHPFYSFELDVAKIAQQWMIKNSDLTDNKTMKQRISEYIENFYPNITGASKKRIAVMVNPSKCKLGGRPKSES
jgi:hypothetical protein